MRRVSLRAPRLPWVFVSLLLGLALGCRGQLDMIDSAVGPAQIVEVEPSAVSARGLEEVALRGSGLEGVVAVHFGDVAAEILDSDDDELRVLMPRMRAGKPEIVLAFDDDNVHVDGLVEILPLELGYQPASVPPYTVPEGGTATAAALGDFDGDGDIDVVVAGEASATAALLLNDGGVLRDELAVQSDRLVAPDAVHGLIAADFDGNGSLDLLFTTAAEHPTVLLVNDGMARFTAGPELPVELSAATRAVAADFDRDGLCDLALADAADGGPAVHILLNRTAPRGGLVTFVAVDPATLAAAGVVAADVVAADIDVDDDPDLVLLHAQPEHADGRPFTFLRNHGQGALVVDQTPVAALAGAGPRRGAVLDAHGDGDPDLYLAGNGQDRLLENAFGQLTDTTDTTLPVDDAKVADVAVADLDLDGLPEVVVAAHGAQNRLYTSATDGRVRDATPLLPIARDETAAVLLADFDDDGADDIFFLNRSGAATLLRWAAATPTAAPDPPAQPPITGGGP